MNADDDLKKTISQLTDEQLAIMLTTESTEYRKEALEFAETELKNRGISGWAQIEAILNPIVPDRQSQLGSSSNSSHINTESNRAWVLKLPKWLLCAIHHEDLKRTISQLTDEQLTIMLTTDSAEYRQEALEFAEAEL